MPATETCIHRWVYSDGLGNFWMLKNSNHCPAERRCMDCGTYEDFRPKAELRG